MQLNMRVLPLVITCLGVASVASPPARADNIETLFARHTPESTLTIDHSSWDGMLKAYLVPAEDGLNRVDYKRFKTDSHEALKAYVRRLEAVDVTRLDRREQFAFWANLYNARSIDIVLDHYPVRSVRDINLGGSFIATFTGGPWKAKVVTVNGRRLSLDDIEHTIMRGIFKDHRVHWAVNCASVGCPNLGLDALTGARLDELLEKGGRDFVNSPRGMRIEDGKLMVSKIFTWFQSDFGGNDAGVIAHLRRYADPPLRARLEHVTRIHDSFYDWSLNDVRG